MQLIIANSTIVLIDDWELMLSVLWIVCIIEYIFILKIMGGSKRKALWSSVIANIFSWIIGFPLAWLLNFLIMLSLNIDNYSALGKAEIFYSILSGNWPLWGSKHIEILIFCLMLIPNYYASVLTEWQVLRYLYRCDDLQKIKKTAISMNRITYVLLGVIALVLYFLYTYAIIH